MNILIADDDRIHDELVSGRAPRKYLLNFSTSPTGNIAEIP
jgi:hypothetical protein